jgi:hypothetical protein
MIDNKSIAADSLAITIEECVTFYFLLKKIKCKL